MYISINIGLGHLAWDMIWAPGPMWAHGPGPGSGGARLTQPAGCAPRPPYHIPGKVSWAYIYYIYI